MTDPVQVVADAVEGIYFLVFSGEPQEPLEVDAPTAEMIADLAVAALKANPDALAALLTPVGWLRRGETHIHTLCAEQDLCDHLYRLPEPD